MPGRRLRFPPSLSGFSLKDLDLRQVFRHLTDSLTSGWYFKDDPLSRSRLSLLSANYTSNIIANLIGGSFLTGLLLFMDADDNFIGTISEIGVAANIIQMFAPLLLERFTKRKKLLMTIRTVQMLVNILFIGLIPLAPLGQQAKLTMVGICVAIANLCSAAAGPGLTVWHIQSVPQNVRNSYFSVVTMTVGPVTALCNLAASRVVDHFTAMGNDYTGLLVIRIVALAVYVVEFFLYLHIREFPYEDTGERFTLKELFTLPFKNKLYLRTIAVTFLWNLSANICGSYYTVYLLRNCNVTYTYITVMSLINIPMLLIFTKPWGRLSSGRSPFRILTFGMGLYLLHYVALAFVTPNTMFMYPLALIWAYIMAIGINLPFSSIPYVNIPAERQTVFIGFYSTMANLAALIGVWIGKEFINHTEETTIHLLGVEMCNKQYLLLLTAGAIALATLCVHFIDRSTPVDK